MDSLILSLEIVLPLFLLMAVGYVIKLTGLMNETSVKQTNKVIFKIFLPLLVFCNIYNTELSESFDSHLLLYAVAGVAIQFVLSLCLAVLTEKENSRRGVMLQGMFRSNFVLFGIPISTALFGETAAGLASILIAVIIPMYNVLAVVSLEIFNGKRPNVGKILVGIITNPLIIASAVGILFVALRIPLPTPIYDTVSDLGSIATPLAFVILGASFSFGDVGRYVKELFVVLSTKLLVFPALFLGIALLLKGTARQRRASRPAVGIPGRAFGGAAHCVWRPYRGFLLHHGPADGRRRQAGGTAGGVQFHPIHRHHVPHHFLPKGNGVPINGIVQFFIQNAGQLIDRILVFGDNSTL